MKDGEARKLGLRGRAPAVISVTVRLRFAASHNTVAGFARSEGSKCAHTLCKASPSLILAHSTLHLATLRPSFLHFNWTEYFISVKDITVSRQHYNSISSRFPRSCRNGLNRVGMECEMLKQVVYCLSLTRPHHHDIPRICNWAQKTAAVDPIYPYRNRERGFWTA